MSAPTNRPGEVLKTKLHNTSIRAFARLSRELVTGALSKTPAFCAKVATTPSDVGLNHRYLICLYLPDLYDKASVTEVFTCLLSFVLVGCLIGV